MSVRVDLLLVHGGPRHDHDSALVERLDDADLTEAIGCHGLRGLLIGSRTGPLLIASCPCFTDETHECPSTATDQPRVSRPQRP
jgi:hypothetical protein